MPDIPAAVAYVQSRQTPDGGFSYYRSTGVEEPAAADTYYALTGLAAVDARPARPVDCVNWLLERQNGDGGYSGIATAWYVAEGLERLGASPRHGAAAWLAPYSEALFDDGQGPDGAHELLLNLLRYVELCRRFGVPLEALHRNALAAHLKRLQDSDGAFTAENANLEDSAIALRLMRAAHLIAGRRVLEFARSAEDATYGFRAARIGQSTSLEVLAAGVAIFGYFGISPTYVQPLLHAVTACQHPNGGFGRRTGALPTLRNTYLALFILKNIQSQLAKIQPRNRHGP